MVFGLKPLSQSNVTKSKTKPRDPFLPITDEELEESTALRPIKSVNTENIKLKTTDTGRSDRKKRIPPSSNLEIIDDDEHDEDPIVVRFDAAPTVQQPSTDIKINNASDMDVPIVVEQPPSQPLNGTKKETEKLGADGGGDDIEWFLSPPPFLPERRTKPVPAEGEQQSPKLVASKNVSDDSETSTLKVTSNSDPTTLPTKQQKQQEDSSGSAVPSSVAERHAAAAQVHFAKEIAADRELCEKRPPKRNEKDKPKPHNSKSKPVIDGPKKTIAKQCFSATRSQPTTARRKALSKADLLRIVKEAEDAGKLLESKHEQCVHLKYWDRFCDLMGIDGSTFGKVTAPSAVNSRENGMDEGTSVTMEQLKEEQDILAAFASYVVHSPMNIVDDSDNNDEAKDSMGDVSMFNLKDNKFDDDGLQRRYNSVDYALRVIGSVRDGCKQKWGRRPGVVVSGSTSGGGKLGRVLNGLRKTTSTVKDPKTQPVPIMHHHLCAIREVLDLRRSHMDRTVWAIWTTLWQGVLRIEHLLRRRGDDKRPWNPLRDMHRSRVTAEKTVRQELFDVVSSSKRNNGHDKSPSHSPSLLDTRRREDVRIKLKLRSSSTTSSSPGVNHVNSMRSFIVDHTPGAVCAGHAIWKMFAGDKISGEPQQTPLFRDCHTGKEVSMDYVNRRLKECLEKAGYSDIAQKPHSLAMGGATALAQSSDGWRMVAGFIDFAHTDPHWSLERQEAATTMIGRGVGIGAKHEIGPIKTEAKESPNMLVMSSSSLKLD